MFHVKHVRAILARVDGQDPSVAQRRAARPGASVWVAASAGAGKTKVLTDRVLRLLLPRADGAPGTPAHRILCLTFTRAGAGEMTLRLRRALGRWAALPDPGLEAALHDLLGAAPTAAQRTAARGLLARVLDSPGGLQIQTIHAFCQSVLARFALEAGLTPGFAALDEEEATQLLENAWDFVCRAALDAPDTPAHAAVMALAAEGESEKILHIIKSIIAERARLAPLLDTPGALPAHLSEAVGVPETQSEADLLTAACAGADDPHLRHAAHTLHTAGSPTDRQRAAVIRKFLDLKNTERIGFFPVYCRAFLTQDDAPLQRLATKAACAALPALEAEAQRLVTTKERLKAVRCRQATTDLLTLMRAVMTQYDTLKAARGALDYDDMIFKTLDLLEGRSMNLPPGQAISWVHYKLDQGIDHILIDEAQDTNPEQWRIIDALTGDFFAGQGAREDTIRTVFAVGDVKQSIFGFQRAAPEAFTVMRERLSARVTQAGGAWDAVNLNVSFRSAPAILRVVDAALADLTCGAGPASDAAGGPPPSPPLLGGGKGRGALLGAPSAPHIPWRAQAPGRVELWPLATPDPGGERQEDATPDIWDPPLRVLERRSGAAKLAERVSREITRWLEDPTPLPSTGRRATPGDILILLRTRGTLAAALTRALKRRSVPASGMDRLRLTEHLAVQDLIAAARAALLPGDDLSLACVLRSPLVGMEDDDLRALAHPRRGTLWEALMEAGGPAADYMAALRDRATRPFAFFASILEQPCPADAVSGRRAMWGRLGADALEPMEAFCDAALDYGARVEAPTLQGFMAGLEAGPGMEVKRDMAEAAGQVRVMTVHGAKGLQAPIVVLPDTVTLRARGASQAGARVVWDARAGLPLWAPGGDAACGAWAAAREARRARDAREEGRLAYVAMTRAQDRLYIGGALGLAGGEPRPESWYFTLRRALEACGAQETAEGGLRLDDPGVATARPAPAEVAERVALPDWAARPAPAERAPAPALRPSDAEGEDALPAPRPILEVARGGLSPRARGEVIHGLLQLLPTLPEGERVAAGAAFARSRGGGAAEVAAALAVIGEPRFAQVFGPDALAEVALAGTGADGRRVSGRIDRLVVGPDAVTIVDFKTGRAPGDKAAGALYRAQMAAYADLVARMYPGRAVRCALLYTQGPEWVEM
jgi:ATP-dependent helicase/nuclease subunit A